MTQNPPAGHQRIIPYLAYADAPKAIDFLCSAYGFEESFRFPMDDGRIGHAELRLVDNVLMLASVYEEMGFGSPLDVSAHCMQIVCYVDDVDAHFARAEAAGATITAALVDQPYGDRTYRTTDPEGYRWIFQTHVRDVSADELNETMDT